MWRFPYNFTNDLHKYVVIEDSKDGLLTIRFSTKKKYTPATLACPKELVKHVYKSRPNDKCTIKGNMFCDVEQCGLLKATLCMIIALIIRHTGEVIRWQKEVHSLGEASVYQHMSFLSQLSSLWVHSLVQEGISCRGP